jgi:hypothetical protein
MGVGKMFSLFCNCNVKYEDVLFQLGELRRFILMTHRREINKMATLTEKFEEMKRIQMDTKVAIEDERTEVGGKVDAMLEAIKGLEDKLAEYITADGEVEALIAEQKAIVEDIKGIYNDAPEIEPPIEDEEPIDEAPEDEVEEPTEPVEPVEPIEDETV